jgi:class 3 adenylate cyclase/tetratricopeptide (TPR) repeat protein
MSEPEREIEDLRKAIEKLEQSRDLLGEDVVESATRPLKERLSLLVSAHDPQTSRRLVTVLFADLVGYTTLSERMDAEEVGELMNALWHKLDATVIRFGGLVDKHMGDSLMAVWGVSEAREDDAERAVRASLAIARDAEEFGSASGLDLKVRVGVNSGLVMIGGIGSGGEQTAMGDTVNVASRLQKEAPPGSVVVSGDVASLVRGLFEMESLGAITARGRVAQVQVHLIRKALPRQFRPESRGIPGVVTTMVGRENELLRLREAYSLCIGSRRAGIILVSGEAGIGKSRLLSEFSSRLASGFGAVELLRGRASPETANTPRGLLRDVFRERFGLLESDPTSVVLDKIRAGMAGLLDPDRAAILGHYAGFDFSAVPAVRDLLGNPAFIRHGRGALLDYFSGMASRNPVVVLLEDLHWSDESSIELVADIVRSQGSRPIVFLCSARPEFLVVRPDWRDGESVLALVELSSLSRDQSAILADQILRRTSHVPAELRRFLVDGAEGNPFYLEELVGMLIQDGVIGTSGESWSIDTGKLSTTKAPQTLKGILQARLDGLAPREREVIQRASVIGRHFWDLAVAFLPEPEEPPEAVDSSLDSACRSGLVQPEAPSTFEKAREYSFRHALLREVAYDTVLLRKRRAYHARVAAWLENIAGERFNEYLSQMATHLELSGDTEGAADRLRRATLALEQTGSNREALEKIEKALSLVPQESAQRPEILMDMANVLGNLSEFARAREILDMALRESIAGGDRYHEGLAMRGLGCVASSVGDAEEAKKLFESALGILREAGDTSAAASCLNNLGCMLYMKGEYAEARILHEEALAIRRNLEDPAEIASSLNNLGTSSFALEDFEAASRYFGECLAVTSRIENRRGMAAALSNLGSVALSGGDLEAAKGFFMESLAIRRQDGDRNGEAMNLGSLGNVMLAARDFVSAREHFGEALSLARSVGNKRAVAQNLANLAELERAEGSVQEARSLVGQALDEAAKLGSRPVILHCLKALAIVLASSGRMEEALFLVSLVVWSSETESHARRSARLILDSLAAKLDPEVVRQTREASQSADLKQILDRYLEELAGPTSP